MPQSEADGVDAMMRRAERVLARAKARPSRPWAPEPAGHAPTPCQPSLNHDEVKTELKWG